MHSLKRQSAGCNKTLQIMNLSNLSVSKLLFLVLTAMFIFPSCEKENIDVVEEEVVEPFNPTMTVTFRGVTTEYDAFATYCSDGAGRVFLNVSNNQLLLDSVLVAENFNVNDFLIMYEMEGEEVNSLGGAAFAENIGGVDITAFSLDTQATVVIEEANEQFVQGSMEGFFTTFSGNQYPYSIEFTAQVIAVAPWCN
ncbi:MAG: hypothetical protein ACKV1O_22395 [Saprospiraceae bacterium]